MKKAAVFNDLSGFGKCSLTAAIPVLSAQGVQCCPMASAVLTNQTGYEYHKCTDLTAMIKDYIDNWQKNNAHFDGIYSGFMTGSKQIELFMDFLDVFYEENTMLLVDPVMGDDGRTYGIYSAALLDGMKVLSRKADVITPNLTEACLLADYDIEKVYSDTIKDVLLPLATEISEKLPFTSQKRPEADFQILKKVRFARIQIRENRWLNRPWTMDFWKYGYQGKKFIVVATKKEK